MDKERFLAPLENKDRVLVARILDQAEFALKKTAPVATDFLDPSEKTLCSEVIHFLPEIKTLFFGGYRKAERQRMVLVPAFYLTEAVESPLAYLSIKPPAKKGKVAPSGAEEPCFTHRDVLGALLGLGLKREKIGDLLLTKDEAQAIVAEEIADFIQTNLTKVGALAVTVEAIDPEQLNIPVERVKEIKSTVASLRLDAVAGIGYGVSRSRMAREIKMAKVKVNWRPVTDPDYKVDVGDVLSMRGRGRVVVAELGGETKKGRLVVKLNRLL
ncbi:MAG TPA: photosystem II S4 domain protein [Firmicutes bacterium]|nr:photosystem II S4 domain protein [Bacillota bacterium]